MAGPMGVLDVTYDAEVDLSSSQWCAIVVGTSDTQVTLPAGANAGRFQGIVQNAPVANLNVHVRKLGISFCIAGADVGRGEPLEIANASGHLRSATAGIGSYVGTAEEGATQGQRFKAFIQPFELTGTGITFSSSSSSSSSNSSSSSSSSSST